MHFPFEICGECRIFMVWHFLFQLDENACKIYILKNYNKIKYNIKNLCFFHFYLSWGLSQVNHIWNLFGPPLGPVCVLVLFTSAHLHQTHFKCLPGCIVISISMCPWFSRVALQTVSKQIDEEESIVLLRMTPSPELHHQLAKYLPLAADINHCKHKIEKLSWMECACVANELWFVLQMQKHLREWFNMEIKHKLHT